MANQYGVKDIFSLKIYMIYAFSQVTLLCPSGTDVLA